MPPLSQLAQMGPGNVFGGLGKGLGAAIGGGISKQIQRPLFNRLANQFRKGNEDKAKLNTLAQLGLTSMPAEGSENYPIFQQMMEANLGMLNQRPDRAEAMWETDPEAARKYLEAEQAMKFGKGKGAGKLSAQDLANTPAALQLKSKIDEVNQEIKNLHADPTIKASIKQKKLGELINARDILVGDYNALLDGKLGYMSPTQAAETINKALTAENTEGQIAMREVDAANKIIDKITAGASKFAAKVKPALEEMRKIYSAQKDVEGLLRDYDAIKNDPNALFQAVKRLAQAIEPGLQVTEGEVNGFTGQNLFTEALGLIQSAKSGVKALMDSLPKGQVAAGRQSSELLKKVLEQATRTIRSTQEANSMFIDEYALSAAATMADEAGIRMMNNPLIPQDQQTRIKDFAKDKVLGELPLGMLNPETFITAIEAVKGDLDSGDDAYKYDGPQTYPDGTEVSLSDSVDKLKENARLYKEQPELWGDKSAAQATATKTLNPIKSQASEGAAQVATTLADDLLAWEKEQMEDQGVQ